MVTVLLNAFNGVPAEYVPFTTAEQLPAASVNAAGPPAPAGNTVTAISHILLS